MSASLIYFNNRQGIKSQTFTSNGNFTVPDVGAALTTIHVTGCGGGGGGQSGLDFDGPRVGGQGGAGSHPREFTLDYAPGTVIPITIGSGGAGGVAVDNSGSRNQGAAGTNSTFGHFTFPGAPGGGPNESIENGIFTLGTWCTSGGTTDQFPFIVNPGQDSLYAAGGNPGALVVDGYGGGGGGAGYGTGGHGGQGWNGPGGPPPGGVGGYGGGGGGGGSNGENTGIGGNGGPGGQGIVIVRWFEII